MPYVEYFRWAASVVQAILNNIPNFTVLIEKKIYNLNFVETSNLTATYKSKKNL